MISMVKEWERQMQLAWSCDHSYGKQKAEKFVRILTGRSGEWHSYNKLSYILGNLEECTHA